MFTTQAQSMQEVPTVYPTLAELENPIDYLSQPKITRIGNKFGMLKLIPPRDWQYVKCFQNDKVLFKPRLQQLNFLHILNRARWLFIKQLNNFYLSNNINIKLTQPMYSITSNHTIFFYDFYIEMLKFINNIESETKFKLVNLKLIKIGDLLMNKALWRHLRKKFQTSVNHPERFDIIKWFREYLKNYYIYIYNSNSNHCISSTNELYPFSMLNDDLDTENSSSDNEIDSCPICTTDLEIGTDTVACQSCHRNFHQECISLRQKSFSNKKMKLDKDLKFLTSYVCENCIVGNGYYGYNNESKVYSIDQFKEMTENYQTDPSKNEYGNDNDETIENLEEKFWSMINDPMEKNLVKYGTDIPYPIDEVTNGDRLHLINLNKDSLLKICDTDISGMNIPWLYIGSKFSTFCWHMEDQYTFSANYQIEGRCKIWYCIPPRHYMNFQKMLSFLTPDLFIKQPDLMHQLISLVSPYDTDLFHKFNIDRFRAVQKPNEFIITFPQCYHSGFNTGYNLNEAVNFITTDWLTFGLKAINDYQRCGKKCVFDIYKMFLKILVENLKLSKGFINNNDVHLCRESYQHLLVYYNLQIKNIKMIKESLKMDEVELDSPTEEEIYCSQCGTICTICFVIDGPCKTKDINVLQGEIVDNQIHSYCTGCFKSLLSPKSTIVMTYSLTKLKQILSLIDSKLGRK